MEKFDGKGHFRIWKFKMLIKHEFKGLGKVLQGKYDEGSSDSGNKNLKPDVQ